ncbi:MAG: hypothetical protein CVV64_03515 [Candidatus Wallbacteria bacterium HGW-Wallbacteria-1]|jgi:ATP-dependent helicase/nuclease subunit A|uniref:DNA 3'-5' helicase n=1 Tax=Candidatus Wallbacteria bacterium HGW-Wallbacteria-1 TaxID=2013854 RepID=A0A2N1PTS5_9BACT|nr:MAG: hypothetical protein CVV64_03515 [Candidatus Wallbacteria bacterium HGW-Wallbacteria-1]
MNEISESKCSNIISNINFPCSADMDHPVVQAMSPSPEQLPGIRARNCDVVMVAGAGTGKTRTLVARYLSLLAEGLPIRSIMAVTFTQKAAREMRSRVRREIGKYVESLKMRMDCRHSELEIWEGYYQQLDIARIGTIHSLCGEILRSSPGQAGLDPDFRVMEEAESLILIEESIDRALAVAAQNDQLADLFLGFGDSTLRGWIHYMITERGSLSDFKSGFGVLSSHESADSNSISTRVQQLEQISLKLKIYWDRLVNLLVESSQWQESLAVLENHFSPDIADNAEIARKAALDGARTVLDALTHSFCHETIREVSQGISGILSVNLRGGKAGAWPGGKEEIALVKEALKTLRELFKSSGAFKLLARFPDGSDIRHLRLAGDVCSIFNIALEHYNQTKKRAGALDFEDLEALSLELLIRNSSVEGRWHNEVKALLVDEFQDTNGRQRDLIRHIAGNRGCLFMVGDAKQSIYRFRGADVTVFREERSKAQCNGGVFELSTSYRTHRVLMDGFNHLFASVMGELDDPLRPWLEPFAPLEAASSETGRALGESSVELVLGMGSKGSGGLEEAARRVAARIAEIVGSGRVCYGDIAILAKSSPTFRYYEDALEASGIPYVTVAGRGFLERPEIRDLVNALKAVLDPSDDLALAGFLRSPGIGVPDHALMVLARIARKATTEFSPQSASPFSAALSSGRRAGWLLRALRMAMASDSDCDISIELGTEAADALGRGLDNITTLHSLCGRVTVAALMEHLAGILFPVPSMILAGDPRGARNIRKFIADVSTLGPATLSEFLSRVAILRTGGVRMGEAAATGDGVQIMTVHASKGLEFPVVVIGDANFSPPGRTGPMMDPHLGLVLPVASERHWHRFADSQQPSPDDLKDGESLVFDFAASISGEKERAEEQRLFYVAATRARDHLIIAGATGASDKVRTGRAGWLGPFLEAFPDTAQSLDRAIDEALRLQSCNGDAADCAGDELLSEASGEFQVVRGLDGHSMALWQSESSTDGNSISVQLVFPWKAIFNGTQKVDEALFCSISEDCGKEISSRGIVSGMNGSFAGIDELSFSDLSLIVPLQSDDSSPLSPAECKKIIERDELMKYRKGTVDHPVISDDYAPSWLAGVMVHNAIALNRKPSDDFLNWCIGVANSQKHGDFSAIQIEKASQRAAELLQRFYSSDIYAEISSAQRVIHEVPCTFESPGRGPVLKIIDALYLKHGKWNLVEFKTDRVRSRSEFQELLSREDYVEQVQGYVDAFRDQLGQTPQPLLCMLDYMSEVMVERNLMWHRPDLFQLSLFE